MEYFQATSKLGVTARAALLSFSTPNSLLMSGSAAVQTSTLMPSSFSVLMKSNTAFWQRSRYFFCISFCFSWSLRSFSVALAISSSMEITLGICFSVISEGVMIFEFRVNDRKSILTQRTVSIQKTNFSKKSNL